VYKLLGADILVTTIIEVIWMNGHLSNVVDPKNLACIFGLAGAAIYHNLETHASGTWEDNHSSAENFHRVYDDIMALIETIRGDPNLLADFERMQQYIVARGKAIYRGLLE